MAIGSTTSNIQSLDQSVWKQAQAQQTQRIADQAEQNARSLQSQANNAQRAADSALQNARSLKAQADQAQVIASQASLSPQVGTSLETAVVQLTNTNAQVAQVRQAGIAITQGQATGTVVNVTA